MKHFKWWTLLAIGAAFVSLVGHPPRVMAQPVFRDSFPPEEYAARRAKLFEQIKDGVVLIEGTTERPGEQPFRQANEFYYLTGVSEARAIALIDGRTKQTIIFLQTKKDLDVSSKYGPGALYPGEETAHILGVDQALPREALPAMLMPIAREGRTLYVPYRPEVLGSASAGDPAILARMNKEDPWDGRSSREEAFRLKLMELAPKAEMRNLDPIVDEMRGIKSAREIAVMTEATRIADLGIMRAMRAAKPGVFEYQLQAESEYEFKKNGAYGPSYFALIATGKNTWYTHYHYNTAKLEDGDLVQYDYAPDYRGYQSDVTRVFPANGHFNAHQREYYAVYLKLYQAMMSSIRVHETPGACMERAVANMDTIVASYKFTDPAIKKAVLSFVDSFRGKRGWLGHAVGLEVHDMYGSSKTFEPGMIFTIEPMLRLPDEHVAVRLEDMLLITPSGYENLSREVPIEINDVEKYMAAGTKHP